MSAKPILWVEVSLAADGPVVGVDARAFFAAVERVGVPAPADPYMSYPRWAQLAFWAGGEDGLRAAHEAGPEGQTAVRAAFALGGKDAVAGVLRSLAQGRV